MRSALTIAAAVLVLGTVPALAQPLDITVRGGRIFSDPAPRVHPDVYVVRTPMDFGLRFDPGQAAANANIVSRFYPLPGTVSINVDRAVTLNYSGYSIAEHQEMCQSLYASYDLVSDTYIGRDGLPRPCRY